MLHSALAAALALPPPPDSGPEVRPLTAEAARADLALFREAFERVHPRLGRYEPAEGFLAACDELDAELAEGASVLELYRELSLLAALVRRGHTRVEAPAWYDEWRDEHPSYLPFRFRHFGGRMFVERAAPEAGLERGTEELAASECEELVLDLRACGGGSADVGWTLARFPTAEPSEVGGPSLVRSIRFGGLRPYLSTWDESVFELPDSAFEPRDDGWYRVLEPERLRVEPHPDRFRGPITAPIGPCNASGATLGLAALSQAGAVRTVGQPTGGSVAGPTAGLTFFLTLPASEISRLRRAATRGRSRARRSRARARGPGRPPRGPPRRAPRRR